MNLHCKTDPQAPLNVFDRCYDKKCPKGWSEDPTGLLCKKNGLSLNTKPKEGASHIRYSKRYNHMTRTKYETK